MYNIYAKKNKKLRNKVEAISFIFYSIGILLFALTKCPACILATALAIPVCLKLLRKEE